MIEVYKRLFLMIGLTIIFISILFTTYAYAKSDDKEVATLYRSSLLGDDYRYHIATFDAKDKTKKGRFDYNWKNCLIARDLFQNQIGVEVKYWCEKGYFR